MIKNLLLFLVCSGALALSPVALTQGQVYAQGIGKTQEQQPEVLAGGDAGNDTTNDNGTTSAKLVPSGERYCVDGTGGDTGTPCLRCDPGLTFGVGCIDVLTGGPLVFGDSSERTTSESGKNKAKPGFMDPQILEKLQGTDSATERIEIMFKILEDKGKLPPKTTQTLNSFLKGDTSAYTLCKKISEAKSASISASDCAGPQVQGGSSNTDGTINFVWGFVLGVIAGEILVGQLEDAGIDIKGITKGKLAFTCEGLGLQGAWPNCYRPD